MMDIHDELSTNLSAEMLKENGIEHVFAKVNEAYELLNEHDLETVHPDIAMNIEGALDLLREVLKQVGVKA